MRYVVLAVVGVAMAGCSGRKKEDRPVEAGDTQPVPMKTHLLHGQRTYTQFLTPPELPQQREVVVDDAGAAPRHVLRYRPDDATRELVITARVEARQLEAGAWTERVALPEIRYGLALGRGSAPADAGAIAFDLRGLEATAGEATGASRESVARLVGEFLARYRAHVERRRATLYLDDRGRLGKLTLTPDSAQDPRARAIEHEILQLVLETVVPLPAEPVGPGARWRATTLMRRGPGVVTQRAEYELLSIDDGVLRTRATLTQIGEHQVIPAPGLPAGSIAELVALFWRVHGELEVSLASPAAVAGALEVEMRVHSRLLQPTGTVEHFAESAGTVALGPR